MAKLGINTGTVPNDGTGDSLLDGAIKINSNFDELYDLLGDGTSLTQASIGGTWVSTSVGIHTLKSVGIGTTNPTSKLFVTGDTFITGVLTASNLNINGDAYVTGVITAANFNGVFIGDGSGLTSVIGSGSGVIIEDNGATVGTAGTINFGDNLSVSPISLGIVTVTSVDTNYWQTTSSGINTLSNVGLGTTNPTSKLYVTGDAYITGVLTATTISGTFIGDGSGLSGVNTSFVSSIGINSGGTAIGSATTINFVGSGITVSITDSVADINLNISNVDNIKLFFVGGW